MRRISRFLVVLLIGLALLTAVAYAAMTRITTEWFEKDLRLRSQLAVTSARQSLIAQWSSDRRLLAASLTDITRDERIMGAAACSHAGEQLAASDGFPAEFSCDVIVEALRGRLKQATTWTTMAELRSGPVQVSATALETEGRRLGFVLLVHDLRFLMRRDTTTRNVILSMFFVMSVAAAVVTLVAARLAWRGWIEDLQRALSGSETKEFRPLVRHVRSLADTLAREREQDAGTGPWNPERLRATLRRHLHGERVVVLANREPYMHVKEDSGMRVLHPASGLVTALEPVMRACSGVWVAHGSGSGDSMTSDAKGHVSMAPSEESYVLRRVWLSTAEEGGYYYGFSNEGLWPLCHVAHVRPIF